MSDPCWSGTVRSGFIAGRCLSREELAEIRPLVWEFSDATPARRQEIAAELERRFGLRMWAAAMDAQK
jgi:hypothetical protein